MAWKTIDLDAPGGYEKYDKLQKTKSVRKTFDDENPFTEKEQKSTFVKEEPKIDTVRKGVVTGVNQLRVRTSPEGEILRLISEKSIVTILKEEDGWFYIESAPGQTGFVMKQFIKEYSETEGG